MDNSFDTNLQIAESLNKNVIPLLEKIAKSSSDFDIALLSGGLILTGVIITQIINFLLEKGRQNHAEIINKQNHVNEIEKVIMSKQQIALQELSKILHKDIYVDWKVPDYSADETYGDIADKMSVILEILNIFNIDHAYILPKKCINMLGNATFACNEANWDGAYESELGYDVSDFRKKQARIVLDNIENCVSELKKTLHIENV